MIYYQKTYGLVLIQFWALFTGPIFCSKRFFVHYYRSIQSKQKYSCRLKFHSVGNLNCPKYIIKELQKATRMVLNHFWKIMKIVFLTATLTQNGNSVGGSFLPNPRVHCLLIVSGWVFQNQYLMVFQVEGIYIAY